MAIREKARALFKSKSKSDRDSQISKTSTTASDRDRWPSNVYKPGEAMPRPKYRAVPKKEHKDKLEAFSFAEAWRRKSFQSQYSPMGTRAPSRRNSSRRPSRRSSWISMGRRSFSGKSSDGRTNSITSGDTEKSNVRQREQHLHAARVPGLQTEVENVEGDDDVGNGRLGPCADARSGMLTIGDSRYVESALSRPPTPCRVATENGGRCEWLVERHHEDDYSTRPSALHRRGAYFSAEEVTPGGSSAVRAVLAFVTREIALRESVAVRAYGRCLKHL